MESNGGFAMRGTGLFILGLVTALVMSTGALGEDAGVKTTPQELQASVQPSTNRVIPEGWYPVTHVRIPDKNLPARMRRAGNATEPRAWYADFVGGTRDIFDSDAAIEAKKIESFVEPQWFANFVAGGNSVFDDGVVVEHRVGSWIDNFVSGDSDVFGDTRGWVEREVEVGEDGYLKFGMIVESTMGYASLMLPDEFYDNEPAAEDEGVRLPKPFSFAPDDSPIIMSEITSPGSDTRIAMVRARTYRTYDGGRRPAEIIERDPVSRPRPRPHPAPSPRMQQDMPAMAAPAGGIVRRAEVKLPTSSQGLGMASGYLPGR